MDHHGQLLVHIELWWIYLEVTINLSDQILDNSNLKQNLHVAITIVPNCIFYLHECFQIYTPFLAIFTELRLDFMAYFKTLICCRVGPSSHRQCRPALPSHWPCLKCQPPRHPSKPQACSPPRSSLQPAASLVSSTSLQVNVALSLSIIGVLTPLPFFFGKPPVRTHHTTTSPTWPAGSLCSLPLCRKQGRADHRGAVCSPCHHPPAGEAVATSGVYLLGCL
jgi:hypothetical protein